MQGKVLLAFEYFFFWIRNQRCLRESFESWENHMALGSLFALQAGKRLTPLFLTPILLRILPRAVASALRPSKFNASFAHRWTQCWWRVDEAARGL